MRCGRSWQQVKRKNGRFKVGKRGMGPRTPGKAQRSPAYSLRESVGKRDSAIHQVTTTAAKPRTQGHLHSYLRLLFPRIFSLTAKIKRRADLTRSGSRYFAGDRSLGVVSSAGISCPTSPSHQEHSETHLPLTRAHASGSG